MQSSTTASISAAYPTGDRLEERPTATTVVITPKNVTKMPIICRLVGFFFKMTVEASRDSAGTQARKTPLSVTVVRGSIAMMSPVWIPSARVS